MENLIKIEEGTAVLAPDTADRIASLTKEAKKLEEALKEIKSRLFEEMKAQNVLKIDMPNLVITYVAETTTESLDSKALKKDLPEIYNEYVTEKPRAGYVKLTTRE